MARESKYIKQLFERDHSAIQALARVGVASTDQLYKYCGLNQKRVIKLENSGYLKIEKLTIHGQLQHVVHLTPEGQKHCSNEYRIYQFPGWQTNHLVHDLKLTEAYFQFLPELRSNWTHENQILAANPKIKRGSCIDAIIKMTVEDYLRMADSNESLQVIDANILEMPLETEISVGIESVGDSYTSTDIEVKINTAVSLGCAAVMTV